MPRRRERSQLGEILYRTRREASLEQTELADKVGSTQPRISDLEGPQGHLEKLLDLVNAIEEACGRRRGYTLHQAGYVSDEVDVPTAIAADPNIDKGRAEALLKIYNILCRESAAEANGQRSEDPAQAMSDAAYESALPGTSTPKRAEADRAG